MGLSAIALLTVGVTAEAIAPQAAHSAEDIRILVEGPLVFDLSVESLATFAETGEVTGDLQLYARFLNEETLQLLRDGLTRKIPLDVVAADNLSYSPLGREILLNVGKVLQAYRGVNGQKALRSAVIGAAANADAEGWTLIDVLEEFPTPALEIELQDLLAIRRQLAIYFSYNDAVVRTIRAQAADEALTQTDVNIAELADLRLPGPFGFTKETITVTNPALRQTQAGLSVNYDFDVDVYIPEGLNGPTPIVIISHGFGDVKESFTFIAEHIASYGFIAILPDHVGSDLAYRQEYLQGRLNTLLSPVEFINRPQEISFLIDKLEDLVAESPDWAARLDLENIGVAGDSLGSTNTLALAGAEINYARLVEACDADNVLLNFSLYLQCRAQHLPPQNYDLKDSRIKAVITGHPLGASLYGPEGFSQIDIPLLMVGGSEDIVAPVVVEQFHPFIWMQTEPKYLAMLDIGTHFSSKPGRDAAGGIFALLAGANRDVGSGYYEALTVAFWNVYLRGQDEFLPYLTASYGNQLSDGQPMGLSIITDLQPEQIEATYGRRPPVPIIPEPLAAAIPPRSQSVLAEIAETGVLTVAFRKDAVPFGFINQEDAWDGYCGDMAIALSNYVAAELKSDVDIQLVELTSTLENRYDLVSDGSVHLECGPNSIRNDVAGVVFSSPIFVTSTQFLVPAGQADTIRPTTPLAGTRLGVLENTTTQIFVEETYPDADIVLFSGIEGRQNAIAATTRGEIDAFVGDGILSYGELLLQGRAIDDFALIPEVPLTCEYYGLALPDNDLEWQTLINQFLISDSENPISTKWFSAIAPETLDKTAFCLNQ
ncbi:MAG: alpha/beta hydrolase [Leptolyngbya sp. SIOISBB]|nr:alpha/beta hydrolase [Leptolyngbya sp. SIOISBB]